MHTCMLCTYIPYVVGQNFTSLWKVTTGSYNCICCLNKVWRSHKPPGTTSPDDAWMWVPEVGSLRGADGLQVLSSSLLTWLTWAGVRKPMAVALTHLVLAQPGASPGSGGKRRGWQKRSSPKWHGVSQKAWGILGWRVSLSFSNK